MSFVCSLYHRVEHRVLEWLAIGVLYHAYELQMQLQLTVACSWAFLLKPLVMGMTSPFKLPSLCKTCFHAPFLQLIWAGWQSGQCSSLWAFCSVLPQPVYSKFPTQLKRQEKRSPCSVIVLYECVLATPLLGDGGGGVDWGGGGGKGKREGKEG